MLYQQFVRYLAVGVLGTLTHLAILFISVEWFEQNAVIGAVAGFLGALIASYLLNHRWSFKSRRSHKSSLWRYIIVSLSGLALNTIMMISLVYYLHWWYFTAQLSVIIIVPVFNFFLNRYWTF